MNIKTLAVVSLLFLLPQFTVHSQSVLQMRLNDSTYQIWDKYIKKYAPSDSAFNVVARLASEHYVRGRTAVSAYVYELYEKYFPVYQSEIERRIEICRQKMLTETPQPDTKGIYHEFITKFAPSEDAFVAVQRLADEYIIKKDWDSAAYVYDYYRPYFPDSRYRFEKIIQLLKTQTPGVIATNLGPAINTKMDEWDPSPTPDGRFMFFSASSRPGGKGMTDVWYSKKVNGVWQAAANLGGGINSYNEETVDNVSADGTGLMLSGTFRGTFGKFDIFHAELDSAGWHDLEHYPKPINSEYTDESANITSDGKAILFASDRTGGTGPSVSFGNYYHGSEMGNMDIYIAFITDTGITTPINLGPTINTPFAERSAYLHPDGKTLYFSSNGHPGLGRLDVFKSERLSDTSWTEWSTPVNLGREINSANDDWGYKVNVAGDTAYFAAKDQPDGFGGWDIYSVTLPKFAKPKPVAIIRGIIKDNHNNPLTADIKWEDLVTGEQLGTLHSDPLEGYFFIVLPLGKKYGYFASKDGYYSISGNLDLSKDTVPISKHGDIILVSKKQFADSSAKIVIRNIFFKFDRADLQPESYPELNRLAKFLKQFPGKTVVIEGHTDSTGTHEYNKELSINRAKAVESYLENKGLIHNKFEIRGYGFDKPVAPNDSEENKALNRRVEIYLK